MHRGCEHQTIMHALLEALRRFIDGLFVAHVDMVVARCIAVQGAV